MTEADLVLLPWARRGVPSEVFPPDPFTPAVPGEVTTTASATINSAPPASVPVTVMGPGHVTGLDRRQVVRTDPVAGSRTFEPNHLALVEFDEPSLPWLFTPLRAGAGRRLRPWLCLVIVRRQPGVTCGASATGGLARLRVDAPAVLAAELPDLADSWAWAHVSAVAESGSATLVDELSSRPERSVSRLLCGRVLLPDTDYLACVVPTFELGRRAGLGLEVTDDDRAHLVDAWTQAQPSVELPVYHQWEFTTGTGGDFASLAMLLRARELPPGLGVRSVDVSASGLTGVVPAGTTVSLPGALRPAKAPPVPLPDPALGTALPAALAGVVNAPAAVTPQEDPLLAPPLYGAGAAGRSTVSSTATRWFDQLNTSPVHRAIAHLGALVVQAEQDHLMASAWAQAADLRHANDLRRRTQLGASLATSLHARHLARMDPDRGLQVLAPARERLVRGPAGPALITALEATGLGAAALSVTTRRLTGRVGRAGGVLRRVRPRPLQPALGCVTLEAVAAHVSPPRSDVQWAEATAAAVRAAPRQPWFAFVPMDAPVPTGPSLGPVPEHLLPHGGGHEPPDPPDPPDPPVHPHPHPHDSAAATQFRQVASALLARFAPTPPPVPPPPPPVPGTLEVRISAAFQAALAASSPLPAFTAQLQQLVVIEEPPPVAADPLAPLRLTPSFPQPMVEPLVELAQDLVLPGLETVLPNTIVPLATERTFVEAYLVGLNTELARELLWREFPTDLTATFFDRFWNSSTRPGRPGDIAAVSTWGDRRLGGAVVADERFVMLVRSELLVRYPDAVVYAVKDGETSDPVFSGAFAPDVRYFGFDIGVDELAAWSVVIQEHPGATRFGVDAATAPGPLAPGGATSADTAKALRREPVRLTIPVAFLLGVA